jgi:hypothetical protein
MCDCQERAEQAELAAFRLQLTIHFLVKDIRAYIARERVFMPRSDKLLELEQSAGIAEAALREDEPWRAVAMQIALLKERINGE